MTSISKNIHPHKFDWPYVIRLVSEKYYEHPEVLKTIDTMCELVWSRYFNFPCFNQMDREDMIQEGRLKSLKMLQLEYFNPEYSLRNFLYTGIRNEMQNFTVKFQKNPICGAENFDFDVLADNAYYEDGLEMETEILTQVFSKFSKEYLRFAPDTILALKERGFTFEKMPVSDGKTSFRSKELVSKFECLCIWQKMDSLRNLK